MDNSEENQVEDADDNRCRFITRSAHRNPVVLPTLVVKEKVEDRQKSKSKSPPFDDKFYKQKKYVENLEASRKDMLHRFCLQKKAEAKVPPLNAETLNYYLKMEKSQEKNHHSKGAGASGSA